jgi:hypothetical protein
MDEHNKEQVACCWVSVPGEKSQKKKKRKKCFVAMKSMLHFNHWLHICLCVYVCVCVCVYVCVCVLSR